MLSRKMQGFPQLRYHRHSDRALHYNTACRVRLGQAPSPLAWGTLGEPLLPGHPQKLQTPAYRIIDLISAAYFSFTTRRFTFIEGVSSPLSIEKMASSSTCFLTFS